MNINEDIIGYQVFNSGGGIDGRDHTQKRSLKDVYPTREKANEEVNSYCEKEVVPIVINTVDTIKAAYKKLSKEEICVLRMLSPSDLDDFVYGLIK